MRIIAFSWPNCMGLSCSGVHILHIYHNCQKPKFHDVSHGHGNSGVARVDQLPGHQVAFYKLNMKICWRDIFVGGLAHTLVQIFKITNIFARARPSIARASARVGPGLATPLHGNALCDLMVSYVQKPSGWLLVTMINWGSKGDLLSV